jgi:hypothetical protein
VGHEVFNGREVKLKVVCYGPRRPAMVNLSVFDQKALSAGPLIGPSLFNGGSLYSRRTTIRVVQPEA